MEKRNKRQVTERVVEVAAGPNPRRARVAWIYAVRATYLAVWILFSEVAFPVGKLSV